MCCKRPDPRLDEKLPFWAIRGVSWRGWRNFSDFRAVYPFVSPLVGNCRDSFGILAFSSRTPRSVGRIEGFQSLHGVGLTKQLSIV